MTPQRFDISEAYKWWDVLRDGNQLTEIRLLSNDGRTASGIFDNIDEIVKAIVPYTNDWNIYYTINRLPDDVRGLPQYNKIIVRPKQTCNDNMMIARDYVCIDLDSRRLSGTNATDEQVEFTKKKANEVYQYLVNVGFNPPTVVFSSSGVHLYLRCAMQNNEKNTKLVKRFLQALSMMFTDEHTDVDEKVFNCARIMRLPSTYSCKGNTMDASRPQRLCKFVKINENKINDVAYFEKVAALYPEEEVRPSSQNNYSTEKFDLESFLDKYNIKVTKIEEVAGGKKYVLDHCVFNESHRGKDAVIFQRDNGAISYVCLHNSCSHYTWKDVRIKFQPDAYSRREYGDYRFKQRQYGQVKEPFTPAVETEDKGKKWLQMSEIKRVNIEDLMCIPTGYTELDKKSVGLFAGELSILSGGNASGKTSWLDCVALNAVQKGFKVGIWSGEMQDWRFQNWIIQIAAGKAFTKRKEGYDNLYYVPNSITEKISAWLDEKLFLYNNNYGNNFQQIFSDVKTLVEEKSVQLIIIDNLAALDIDSYDGEKYTKQTKFVIELKEFAKQKNIHILLVCHPRKQMTFLRKDSISGTADLTNISDKVFIIHRIGKDFEQKASEFLGNAKASELMDYDSIVEVAKDRQFGIVDYFAGMYYEQESRRLKNSIAEHIVYGWYDQPTQIDFDYSSNDAINTFESQQDIDNEQLDSFEDLLKSPF